MRHHLIALACIATSTAVAAQTPRAATVASPTVASPHIAAHVNTLVSELNTLAVHANTIAAHGISVAQAHVGLAGLAAVRVNHNIAVAAHAPAISAWPVHAALANLAVPAFAFDAPAQLPPESWAPQDPADSLWRVARERLNANEPERAAQLYAQIRTNPRYARSAYRAPSYYWEAFARERMGSAQELRAALRIIEQLKRDHPQYEGMDLANSLEATINGRLAQLGDAQAAGATRATAAQATRQQCDETQMYALDALIHMPPDQSMPILKRVMQRRDCDEMREKAVFLISQSRSPEAEDILVEAARNDPNQKVKESAVFFLSQVDSEKAIDAIDGLIRSGVNQKLMEAAVFALSQHRSPRGTEMLRQLVMRQDLSADVRAGAVFALSQRADANATPLLRTLYGQTTDRKVKEMILFALSQRPEPGNAEFLMQIALNEREDIETRKHALFSAGQHGQGLPVNRLAELYRSVPNIEMRQHIMFMLGQSKDPEAVPQMIEILRAERDPSLRKSGIIWLGQSRDPRAIKFISELIGG